MKPTTISFIKTIGIVAITSVLAYLGDAANLSAVVSLPIATVVAGLASMLETYIREHSGNALFGVARVR